MEHDKHIGKALSMHDVEDLSFYDVVIMNPGNNPPIKTDMVLKIAHDFKIAGVKMLYLSTYNGVGNIKSWDTEDTKSFVESGAHFVPIDYMVGGLEEFTVGSVQNLPNDPHYCLPGPPDEIALLLLKLIWALV
jgi:hypothetical protein